MLSAAKIHNSTCYFQMEFEKLNVTVIQETVTDDSKWKPPLEDHKTRIGGWGFLVRDKHDDVLAAGAGNIKYAAPALFVEAMVANSVILYASQMGMTRIILELDNTELPYASCTI